ncbi:MAG: ATP-dependent nuclease [Promethearchaeota archaeon]
MRISLIEIKNFRNFEDLKVNLNNFNIIIGSNNIGKTNFLKAIQLILNPDMSYKRSIIEDDDFREPQKPILIRIKFEEIEDEIIQNLKDGVFDPVNNCILLEFRAKWNQRKKEIEKECFFIREDSLEKRDFEEFFYRYNELFQFHSIDSLRLAEREISMRKRGDLEKLLNFYVHNFIISFNTLKKDIERIFIELNKKINHFKSFNEINGQIKEILQIFNKIPSKTGNMHLLFQNNNGKIQELNNRIATCISNIQIILSRNDENLEGGQITEILDFISKIDEYFKTFKNRLENQKNLFNLKKNISEMNDFKSFNEDLKDIIQNIMPNIDIDFSFISIQDNELLKKAIIEIDSFPLLSQGTGYQSNFVIAFKMLKIFSILKDKDLKSAFVAIEEPEAHLHPHLQRQFVNNLRNLQNTFKNKYGINIQIIVTSHSANILSRIMFFELIVFKKHNDATQALLFSKDFIDELIASLNLNQKELNKKGAKIRKGLSRTFEYMLNYYPDLFFSKGVIIGDGETEEGALPEYARILDSNFDSNGITYINTRGEGNIQYYLNILNKLKIKYVYILDKDKKKEDYKRLKDEEFITIKKAFEAEIIETLPVYKILDVLFNLSNDLTNLNRFKKLKSQFKLPDSITKFEETIEFFRNHPDSETELKNKKDFKAWVRDQKGILFGKLIAKISNKNEIPKVYSDAIKKTIELAVSGGG